jgi:hypothetical protein
MKHLRLRLAKWALSGKDIGADDLSRTLGIDLNKTISDAAINSFAQLPTDTVAALILQNTKLNDLQKLQISAILLPAANADSRKPDYLQ